jgi:exodeoxyribonuclease V gamma subunit
MERWLAMELARRLGVCAHVRFPFPNALIDEVFSAVLGDLPDPSPFDVEILTWRVLKHLPVLAEGSAGAPLKAYLEDDPHGLKHIQLAQRVARLFDQYLLYRPDMVLAWEKSAGADWQAVLWQALTAGGATRHHAELRQAFFRRVRRAPPPHDRLPERITVFGISSLPPFHMEILAELSRLLPVRLFLLSPCREFWGDIRAPREASTVRRSQSAGPAPAPLPVDEGNRLLASLGGLGRDFHQLIQEFVGEEHEDYQDPGEASLLSCLQSDILHLQSRGPVAKRTIAATDTSLTIHSCHSPMREMEVLHDQLLAMFTENPALEPRDILVMTPDIHQYAPYVQAVFGAPEERRLDIPFSIADRSLRSEGRLGEALLALLEVGGSRLGASQMLALLDHAVLRRRFDLEDSELELIHRWVRETGIRWGVDGDHRQALGFPPFGENSWQAGLDRMLLGYAMPGAGAQAFGAILPYDAIEGDEARVLGKLLAFTRKLFTTVPELEAPRTLTEWAETLAGLLADFFDRGTDEAREAQFLRDAVNDLRIQQQRAGFHEPVGAEVVRYFLRRRLEDHTLGQGFLTGGVTFCAMLPMRSIPCQVLCLVGMNDAAFPRQAPSLRFDCMAKAPRLGDRSQRNDDRYLFLEALLSARQRLYISYVGQSIADNSPIPPSVLVSELLEVIDTDFEMPGKNITEQLVTRHRLQPFSPVYFQGDPKFFSHSQENLSAARARQERPSASQPFLSHDLPPAEEEWRRVDVDQLAAFFAHPARFFLKRRLHVHLPAMREVLEDREAFDLDRLAAYRLEDELLERRLAGEDPERSFFLLKASGKLPHGEAGACRYRMLVSATAALLRRIAPYNVSAPLPSRDAHLKIGPYLVVGSIDRLTPHGLLHYRPASVKPRDRLNLWIRHLVLGLLPPGDVPPVSILVGSDGEWRYRQPREGRVVLEALLELYWLGLQRPLPFFPKASFAYAENVRGEGFPLEAVKKARAAWHGHPDRPGDAEDAHVQLCFGAQEPLGDDFRSLAVQVFEPLLEHEVHFSS